MWIGPGLSFWYKIPCGSPTISKILPSTFIKTLWPAHAATSAKDRWIGGYSTGLKFHGNFSVHARTTRSHNTLLFCHIWPFAMGSLCINYLGHTNS